MNYQLRSCSVGEALASESAKECVQLPNHSSRSSWQTDILVEGKNQLIGRAEGGGRVHNIIINSSSSSKCGHFLHCSQAVVVVIPGMKLGTLLK